MYIIGFNGPPQSGKDTLAQFFVEELEQNTRMIPVIQTSLSNPLREIAYSMIGRCYPDSSLPYEEFKLTPFPVFDRIGRQLMIDASERFLKPLYGQDIMAKMLLESIPQGFPGVVLIRDSGFQVEIDPIIQAVGPHRFLVVRVHRPHCSFESDSREWVCHPDPHMNVEVENRYTLDMLRFKARELYQRTEAMGWMNF